MTELVVASLLAGPLPTTAGEPLLVGIQYEMKPGWHIYWRNPGDTGIATWAEVKGPQGWEAGPLGFPGPERIAAPGGLVNYGYTGTVTLLMPVEIKGGAKAAKGSTLEVQTGWLACTESLCVPGEATLKVSLDGKADSKAAPAVSAAKTKLPGPLPAEAKISRAADSLVVSVPGATELRFFPEKEAEGAVVATVEGAELRLALGAGAPKELGLVSGRSAAGQWFWYTLSR